MVTKPSKPRLSRLTPKAMIAPHDSHGGDLCPHCHAPAMTIPDGGGWRCRRCAGGILLPPPPAKLKPLNADDLRYESAIIWLIDPATMPYVRQFLEPRSWRPQAPRYPSRTPRRGLQLVGYTTVSRHAPRRWPNNVRRRAFVLTPGDRYHTPHGPYRTTCPIEGVDPLTVAPGVPGDLTYRAWYAEPVGGGWWPQ